MLHSFGSVRKVGCNKQLQRNRQVRFLLPTQLADFTKTAYLLCHFSLLTLQRQLAGFYNRLFGLAPFQYYAYNGLNKKNGMSAISSEAGVLGKGHKKKRPPVGEASGLHRFRVQEVSIKTILKWKGNLSFC